MGAKPLDTEINSYLHLLTDRQKEAVLTIVRTFAEDAEAYDHWKDPFFVAELDRRTLEYETGKARTFTLNELEENAIAAYKANKVKK